mmetsp:Transcript_1864/g.3384  ORF Transcript_1864/g.3384 Transcript_1864/m.3384 type:complete len:80 (+) Transcript_1864:104-343(+)
MDAERYDRGKEQFPRSFRSSRASLGWPGLRLLLFSQIIIAVPSLCIVMKAKDPLRQLVAVDTLIRVPSQSETPGMIVCI